MKEDLERFLMELEEKHCWDSYELMNLNRLYLERAASVIPILRTETARLSSAAQNSGLENGLCYSRSRIVSSKKPLNSAARHLDLIGHAGSVNSCKLSRCMLYVLSCSDDLTARLWLVSTGLIVMTFSGHSKRVNDCDIHGKFQPNQITPAIVTCSSDSTINFWNSTSEGPLKVLRGHEEAVYCVSFSPNDCSIVSCSEDRTVRTWSFPDGFPLHVFRGHTSPVNMAQFSPSGRY